MKQENRIVRSILRIPCSGTLLKRRYRRLFHSMECYMKTYRAALARDLAWKEKRRQRQG